MVLYTMIQNWFTLVSEEKVVTEVFRRAVQWLMDFFYTENGILASPW